MDNGKLELSLKWNNFTENIVSCLESSYGDQDFVDVTLACEGGSIKAHRLILSASSLYLRRVLKQENCCPHPVVILKGVTISELEALLLYMYHGEVRISEQDIPRLLDVAKFLEIRGLTTIQDKKTLEKEPITSNQPVENLNNNSSLVSSELRSMLMNNQESDSAKKLCRQIPRLQSILQSEVTNTQPENVSSTFNSNCQQKHQITFDNGIKEEVEDLSNDSMVFEIDNSSYSEVPYQSDASVPQANNDNQRNNNDQAKLIYQNQKLAFYEPRPCPKCNKMYRDAATLRTHTSIMHEVLPHRISCTCGAKFLTKYDMYMHRKRGHK